ncbi:MAG: glycosyltransferase [ANME-2 cluster archaeon]|nr:MAG: glycosyltransferase [ANME-2 cluster archaeon]
MAYIEAIKILKNKYNINIEVDICGDGSLRESVEKTILKNEMNIKLHGFVNNPTDYLVTSKFAFVSGYLAILEAMINKKLVFSIYENELKKDYLTLIPNINRMMIIASSSEELADKIAYYNKNTDAAEEMVKNADSFAKEQTWEKVADTYLKLWDVK